MLRDTPDHLLDRALPLRRLRLPAELLLGKIFWATMFVVFCDRAGCRPHGCRGPEMATPGRGPPANVPVAKPGLVRAHRRCPNADPPTPTADTLILARATRRADHRRRRHDPGSRRPLRLSVT